MPLHGYRYVCRYIHIQINMSISSILASAHIGKYASAHIGKYVHLCIYVYTHTHTYTHMQTHAHTYAHKHKRTHTYMNTLSLTLITHYQLRVARLPFAVRALGVPRHPVYQHCPVLHQLPLPLNPGLSWASWRCQLRALLRLVFWWQ